VSLHLHSYYTMIYRIILENFFLSLLLNRVVVAVQVWQITPVGGIYMLLISPIVHRLLICYGYDFDCTPSIPYHVEQIIWFAASAFFFTAEFPQSLLAPGSCDHFFHGHQVYTVITELLFTQQTRLFSQDRDLYILTAYFVEDIYKQCTQLNKVMKWNH